MIFDIHIHPFCKDALITPNLEEGIQRMFGKHEPKRREILKGMIKVFFTHRTMEDMIRDMNEAGVDKACTVSMDLTSHSGVELVTNEHVSRIA
jgi:hypothetical protein